MSGGDGEGLARALALDRGRLLTRFAQAARALRHRDDPAAAHDVRVSLRRLEAALDLWRPFLSRRPRRRAARAMRELRRALGPAREARTIVDLLDRWASSLTPADRATALEIARHARRRLCKVEGRSADRCDRPGVRRLRVLVAEAWPDRGCRWAPGGSRFQRACDRVDRRRALAVSALQDADARASDEALHAARLAVKRWRYASERLAAIVPVADAPTRDWLEAVQQTLGRVSDLRALRGFILGWARKHRSSAAGPAPCRGLLEELEAERAGCMEEFRRLLSLRPLNFGRGPARPSADAASPPDR